MQSLLISKVILINAQGPADELPCEDASLLREDGEAIGGSLGVLPEGVHVEELAWRVRKRGEAITFDLKVGSSVECPTDLHAKDDEISNTGLTLKTDSV